MSVTSVREPVPLDRAELIEISGNDAPAFAHAQFASDVAALPPQAWQWSSWLNAQGRTRCVFALLRVAPDRFVIWLPLGGAAAIRDALARFVLRAKVQLSVRDDWALASLDDTPPGGERSKSIEERDGGYAFAQPGARAAWLGPAPSLSPDAVGLAAWRRADIAAGLPLLAPATQEQFVPQALDLPRLDAIRFDKGCYPGQEIAARLHFRGGAKQRLCRMTLRGDGDVAPGARVVGSDGNVGSVLYAARMSTQTHAALAVLADASRASLQGASVDRHVVEDVSTHFDK